MKIGILYSTIDHTHLSGRDLTSENEIIDVVQHVSRVFENDHTPIPARVSQEFFHSLTKNSFDFIFNLVESIDGNPQGEILIPAYLDFLGIPYTGSNAATIALCLDKVKTKQIFLTNSIPTPRYEIFETKNSSFHTNLNFPLIVKPIREDASIGIDYNSVVYNETSLVNQINYIIDTYHQEALVEEYIDGRELNVAIIGNGSNVQALPISEILFEFSDPDYPKILCYDAKWKEDSMQYKHTREICPSVLDKDTEELIIRYAIHAYHLTGCRDYARVDFRLRGKQPFALEVNPNPCINIDSGFFKSSKAIGLSYKEMIYMIFLQALQRQSIPIPEKITIESEIYQCKNISARRATINDTDHLVKWFNDSENLKFMNEPDLVYSREMVINYFFVKESSEFDLIFIDNLTQEPLGYALIYNINPLSKQGEISFLIGEKKFQGKGYGSEITSLLTRIGFETLGLNSLVAFVTEANIPSFKACKNAGFKEGGRIRNYQLHKEKLYDEYILDILKDEYFQKSQVLR